MRVDLREWAWLRKEDLTASQLSALREKLTIQPRKVGNFPGDAPAPLKLYADAAKHFGVPREFFLRQQSQENHIRDLTTEGVPLRAPLVFIGELRGTQETAVQSICTRFKRGGEYGGLLRATPGWGKTVASCALIARMGVPTLVVVHKEFLVDQWRERIAEFLPNARVGMVQQDTCDYEGYDISIGMVHSLAARDYGRAFYDHYGLVITDECFVSTQEVLTLEGRKRISDIRVGDIVLNALGEAVVQECSNHCVRLSNLRVVRFEDGREVLCTSNHPFMTTDGWCSARDLQGRTALHRGMCLDIMRSHETRSTLSDVRGVESSAGPKILLSEVHGGVEAEEGSSSPVCGVSDRASEATQVEVLFAILSGERTCSAYARETYRDFQPGNRVASGEPEDCAGRVREDDKIQSYEVPRGASEGISDVAGDGTSALCSRREWQRSDGTAVAIAGSVGRGLGSGAYFTHECKAGESEAPARALQTRLSVGGPEVVYRSGRPFTCSGTSKVVGCEEGRIFGGIRVARVTCAEPRDLDRFGVGCEPGTDLVRVYNIGVAGHPSYTLADTGVVVHNCHRIGAETWAKVPTKFPARWRLGVTATPRRKDGADNVFRWHIGPVIFASKEQRMSAKVRRLWTQFRVHQTPSLNPALISRSLLLRFLCANTKRNRAIAAEIAKAVMVGRKVLVLSERLNHLDRLDQLYQDEWKAYEGTEAPAAGYYVGGMKEAALKIAAEARVIFATAQFASEGLDIPALDTLVITTPMSDVEQATGRILRPFEGKKPPIVVDVRDPNMPICERSAQRRDQFYLKKGWG